MNLDRLVNLDLTRTNSAWAINSSHGRAEIRLAASRPDQTTQTQLRHPAASITANRPLISPAEAPCPAP